MDALLDGLKTSEGKKYLYTFQVSSFERFAKKWNGNTLIVQDF